MRSTQFNLLILGIVETFEYPKIIIDISEIKSLKQYSFDQNLILGANMSIESCITIFNDVSKKNDDFSYLSEFAAHLKLVAHIPVRTVSIIFSFKFDLANNFLLAITPEVFLL